MSRTDPDQGPDNGKVVRRLSGTEVQGHAPGCEFRGGRSRDNPVGNMLLGQPFDQRCHGSVADMKIKDGGG